MATYIGTNFALEGKEFLDQRQGLAGTKEDLKNWSVVVPEGFELCLGGSWYYYDSTVNLPETGHWVPRVSDVIEEGDERAVTSDAVYGVTKDVGSLREDLTSLDNTMYPTAITSLKVGTMYTSEAALENHRETVIETINALINAGKYQKDLDINQDGNLDSLDLNTWNTLFNTLKNSLPFTSSATTGTYWQEVGSYMLPRITWKVTKPIATWKISGSSIVWSLKPGSDSVSVPVESGKMEGETDGVFDVDYQGWTSMELLSSSTPRTFRYTVTCTTPTGNEALESGTFGFGLKRYWGVGDLSIWNSTSLRGSSFSGAFTTGGTFPETSFNCSGGKYPYLLVPSTYYRSSYNTYVSKNLNSDFLVKDVQVTNAVGVTIPYKMYRTNYIQTGNPINIEIK